jgi:putative redox protein
VKITLTSDDAIRLEPTDGPLTIEADTAERAYSPFHMLASALATCALSVLYSWATHAGLGIDDLAIDVSWTFAEQPHRVGEMRLAFTWPSLPENRRAAAKRAAALCTVHTTLHHPPAIAIEQVGVASREAAAVPAGR